MTTSEAIDMEFNDPPPPKYSDLPLAMQAGLSQPTPSEPEITDLPEISQPSPIVTSAGENEEPIPFPSPPDSKPHPEFHISIDTSSSSNPPVVDASSEASSEVTIEGRKSVFQRMSRRLSRRTNPKKEILCVYATLFFIGSLIPLPIVGGLVIRPYVLVMSFVETNCTIVSAVLDCSCPYHNCSYTCRNPCMLVKVMYTVNGVDIATKLSLNRTKTKLGGETMSFLFLKCLKAMTYKSIMYVFLHPNDCFQINSWVYYDYKFCTFSFSHYESSTCKVSVLYL